MAGPEAAGPAGDALAAKLRGFGPVGVLSLVLVALSGSVGPLPLGALLVLLWARLSRTPVRALGFVRPASWWRTALAGIACGVAFKLVMKAIVMPLLGADPVNPTYHYLVGNRSELPGAVWMMVVNAGFGEETVFRGFLFARLGQVLGDSGRSRAAIVLLTSVAFGLAHWANQGLPGVEQATIVGLVLGSAYAGTRRLPLLMFLHAAFDLTALAIIFTNSETRVAHLVFH